MLLLRAGRIGTLVQGFFRDRRPMDEQSNRETATREEQQKITRADKCAKTEREQKNGTEEGRKFAAFKHHKAAARSKIGHCDCGEVRQAGPTVR